MSTVPATFKAYTYVAYGNTEEVVKLRTVSTKPLEPTNVRIQVVRAALNPVDYALPEGLGSVFFPTGPSADKPFGFGFDAAGVIAEVGASVDTSKLKVGDEVYAMTPFSGFGTIAEYVDIDQQYVAHTPVSLNFDQAAGVPLVALTSYQGLFEHAKLKTGQRVLVLGGSSATGFFAVQLAKTIGAYVIATASGKNSDFVKSLGADEVIDYRTQRWIDIIEHHSIDVVYDCGVEPHSWNDDAQTVLKKETGQFVTLLPVPEPIESKYGAKNHGQILVYPSARDLNAINDLFAQGKLKTVVDSVVPFDKVLDGVARVKSRRAVGKVVIQVA